MFDPTKLTSPLNHVIDAITPNIDKLVLYKDTTRVVSLKPTTPYYNTQATIHDYDVESSAVSNTRDINYNRIDIGKYIESRAKVNTMSDGTSEYVLVTSDVDVITRQAGITLVTSVLNNNYNLPIEVSDLTMVKSEPLYQTTSSFGAIYLLANGIISGDTLMYVSGDVVVYNLPDTTPTDYNKVRTKQRGMSFYREWTAGDTIEITMPSGTEADGWSMQIEDVNAIGHIGNGILWLHVYFDSNSGHWIYKNGEREFTIDGNISARFKLIISGTMITVVGQTMDTSDGYITQFEDVTATSMYVRGLNRVTMYSNNPMAPSVNFKMNIQTDGSGNDGLIENTKQYTKQITTIKASDTSNALIGTVKYPIMVTRFDNEGYNQPKPETKFVGNTTEGFISSVDLFNIELRQVLEFNIHELNTLLKNNDVKSFTVTILNKDNVNFRYQVECKPIIVDDVITSIEVLTKHNGEVVFSANKAIGDGDGNIVVNISNFEIQIIKDGDLIAELQTFTIGDIIQLDAQLQFLARLDTIMNNGKLLPTVSITKSYVSTNES